MTYTPTLEPSTFQQLEQAFNEFTGNLRPLLTFVHILSCLCHVAGHSFPFFQ